MAEQTESSTPPPASGSSGLDPKVAAGIAAIFPLVGGIIFLLVEKKNAYVRFYAMQGIVFAGAVIAVDILLMILAHIPLLGGIIALLTFLAIFVIWLIQIIKAFSGVEWEIPILGKMARNFLKTTPV